MRSAVYGESSQQPNEHERRREDRDGGEEGADWDGDEVADEGGGGEDRHWGCLPDRDGIDELFLGDPAEAIREVTAQPAPILSMVPNNCASWPPEGSVRVGCPAGDSSGAMSNPCSWRRRGEGRARWAAASPAPAARTRSSLTPSR